MNKLDLLLFVDNSIEIVGGAEKSTEVIIEALKDEISIGIVQPYSEVKMKNVKNYKISKKTRLKHIFKNPFSLINYIIQVYKIVNKNKPKVIHTQGQISFFIVSFLKKLKLISTDSVLIHTERGLYVKYGGIIRNIFMYCLKSTNLLITTTQFNKGHWSSALSDQSIDLPVKVIENTAGKLFETYEEELNNSSDPKKITVGFAGRYTDWKNWELAESIIYQLERKLGNQLNVKLAVGCLDSQSLQSTQKMFERIKERVGHKSFSGEVNINLEEMNKFYYSIDVFVLTSKKNTESFGRTLVEAMSRKTAVLTTDAGGTVEVVGDNKNVLAEPKEFCERIYELYKNNSKLEYEKNKGYERVHKVYALKNNINKHKTLYDQFL